MPRHLPRPELLDHLAGGHRARVTVLTPNRRLAQSLQADFARARVAAGQACWEAPDILPYGAFVARLWDDALHSDLAAGLPTLLAPAQEQALWEEALAGSPLGATLLSIPAAAAQCRAAWSLAQRWRLVERLARHDGHEDARAFLDWSQRYQRAARSREVTDAARLPDQVAALLPGGAIRKPALLAFYGFDLPDPQQAALRAAFAALGVEVATAGPVARAASVRRVEFTAPEDELDAAARWARSRLEADPGARLGIVVPELAALRTRAQRALARVLQPDHPLPGRTRAALPFDLSLGAPLDAQPLVRDALLLLRLCGREARFEEASRVLRSPFIAGAEREAAARARADALLRRHAGVAITVDALARALAADAGVALAAERFARLAEHRRAALFAPRSAAEWARAFSDTLRIAGFPGERTLDSLEFQALDKWHEALATFATLERVTGRMGFGAALARLARLAREALFQPEAGEVPIQVLGVLESAGLEFDHLWVTGLTDEAWPLAARPNPFLPLRLQREAGIPGADPLSSLELDRRITQGWLGAAGEVVLSHARMKGDSELGPSPLVAAIAPQPLAALALPRYPLLRDAIRAAGALERLRDERAPPLAVARAPGGTALFRDQAACPFRAFAVHRLDARALEAPQPGLSAADRGTLLHETLRALWRELGSKAALDASGAAALGELLARCAAGAVAEFRRRRRDALPERFAALEARRLAARAGDWLQVERGRGDFTVLETEARRDVTFGGVTVEARIDRIDALAQGGRAVLDYKAGAAEVASWLGARPDEPQLPMYALDGGDDVRAIAFARLKPGALGFEGVAMEPGLLPRVGTITSSRCRDARRYAGWAELRAGWQREVEALGRGVREGDARVDPKHGSQTCKRCQQQLLCRVAARADPEAEPA